MICRPMRMTSLRHRSAGAKSSHGNGELRTGRGIGGSLNVMGLSLVRIIDPRRYAGMASLLSLYELLLRAVMTIAYQMSIRENASNQRHPRSILR